jgi:DNA-directed RNA polymerase subunit RPC12/RpoP
MQTLDSTFAWLHFEAARLRQVALCAVASICAAIAITGCKPDQGYAAMETDAHGYVCLNCNAKFFTGQKEFLESKCPKCQQETLADVVGYLCVKDQHLTIRPKTSGPEGAAVCEKCGTHLKDAMVSPREKDLKAWGAIKAVPQGNQTTQHL